jgi:hypothetical protein
MNNFGIKMDKKVNPSEMTEVRVVEGGSSSMTYLIDC